MGKGYGERPVKDGFAAIGWSSMGDLSKLPANREAFKKVVASTYPALKPGAIPVVAGTLFKFACEMQIGDLVVYPSKVEPTAPSRHPILLTSYYWRRSFCSSETFRST